MNRCEYLANSIKLGKINADSILIISNVNRFYFSGFNSSEGIILILKDSSYLLVDFRYYELAKSSVKNMEVELFNNINDSLIKIMKDKNIKSVALETEGISLAKSLRFKELFNQVGIETIIDSCLDSVINNMKMIKSDEEVYKMKESQRLTDESFRYITNKIKKGMTEREIALDIEFFMRKNGAEKIAFDFIVVSGENTSMPHGVPTNRVIKSGDLVTMDIGAVLNGYHSDMTRTIGIDFLDDEKKRVYEIVLNAQIKAIKSIKAGVKCSFIDKVARDVINKEGYEKCFGHATGHSLGLEIHEKPSLSPKDDTVLKENMVVTVEPGIYLENKFGVRIEDMICVKKDECINFTGSPKELMIL